MVRTRNKSEDVTASTKKTRGKRNIEHEDAAMLSVKSKKSGTTETPLGEERRATRNQNRRDRAAKNSEHSDIENEVEPTKISTRRRNDAKIEGFGTKSALRQPTNFTGELSTTTAIGSDNISARSLRQKKKDKVLLVSDDNNSSIPSTPSKRTAVETAASKSVVTEKNEVENTVEKNISANDDLISEDDSTENIQSAKQLPASDVLENSLITEDESANDSHSLDETFTKLRNRRASVLRKITDTPKKPSPQKQTKTRVKESTDIVTPQSSPIVVNLTPHRSSKTPKKSPVNLSSPKTHSQSPLHLSKTPRKLPISIDSPAASEKSSPCLRQNNFKTQLLNSQNIPVVVLCDIQQFSTNVHSGVTNPGQTLKSPTVESNSTFCKSSEIEPKISKSKSPLARRQSVLASKIKKTPVKIGNNISSRKSPKRTSTKASADEITAKMPSSDGTPAETGKRSSRSSGKIVSPSNTPIAIRKTSPLLETQLDATESATKISGESEVPANNVATITSAKTPFNINISLVNGESPKRLRSSVRKRSPITSSGTPLRPIPLSNDESLKSSVAVPNSSDGLTPATITPRNLIRRSLNLTPDFKMLSSNSTSSPMQQLKSKIKNSKTSHSDIRDAVKSKTNRDESVELLDASQFMNESDDICENSAAKKDGTYEIPKGTSLVGEDVQKAEVNETKEEDAEVTERNATYEVTEPKTPSLQIKSRKRSMSVVEPSNCTPSARKRCRVRFASPVMSPNRNSMRTTPETLQKTPMPNRSISSRDRSSHNLRRRSNSLTSVGKEKAVDQRVTNRRSMSTSELNKKTPRLSQSTQDSVNRLSRPRFSLHTEAKPEIKPSSAKKAPNFAQIHEKNFAKMESLVDAKKRVVTRHLQLNRAQPGSSSEPSTVNGDSRTGVSRKPSATQLDRGEYNRFGFKLRKKEAISAVTKKLPAKPRIENRRENKRVVQAVRTNRRFELLMKMRKIEQ